MSRAPRDKHPQEEPFRITYLPLGCQGGFVASETFAIQDSSLARSKRRLSRAKEGCYGAPAARTCRMEEVFRQRVPDLDRTLG